MFRKETVMRNLKTSDAACLKARLRLLRIQSNLTQRQMADELGINRSTYTYYELGKCSPSLDTISKLADFFQVSTDYLLGRVCSEEKKK